MTSSPANEITILHLYPRDMNIYGDNGNLQVLTKRLEWHGYAPTVIEYNPGDEFPHSFDIIVGGGGQDSGQDRIHQDLLSIGTSLKQAAENGTPMLMVCGLYQLFGHRFVTATGSILEGIGIFDAETIGTKERLVGNIVLETELFGSVVGYENHSGQTSLGPQAQPFGTVRLGAGNNSTDGHEGVLYKNVIGTYLHGPILPKNPAIADFLISTAATNRYGSFTGVEIDDSIALEAKRIAQSRPR